MGLNREQLAALIPHAGAMCLLDRVVAFDAESIHCVSGSHRSPENPLRRDGRLSVLVGVEYAAQAMAVHGALLSGEARPGFLALVKEVESRVERLDDLPGDLDVHAFRLAEQPDSLMYRFELAADGQGLLRGRLAVFFR